MKFVRDGLLEVLLKARMRISKNKNSAGEHGECRDFSSGIGAEDNAAS